VGWAEAAPAAQLARVVARAELAARPQLLRAAQAARAERAQAACPRVVEGSPEWAARRQARADREPLARARVARAAAILVRAEPRPSRGAARLPVARARYKDASERVAAERCCCSASCSSRGFAGGAPRRCRNAYRHQTSYRAVPRAIGWGEGAGMPWRSQARRNSVAPATADHNGICAKGLDARPVAARSPQVRCRPSKFQRERNTWHQSAACVQRLPHSRLRALLAHRAHQLFPRVAEDRESEANPAKEGQRGAEECSVRAA